jgi:hypothetical protein
VPVAAIPGNKLFPIGSASIFLAAFNKPAKRSYLRQFFESYNLDDAQGQSKSAPTSTQIMYEF